MSKFKIWLLVIMIYLAMFGTPIATGYILFEDQIATETGYGFISVITASVFIVALSKILHGVRKQKAGNTKAIFKVATAITTLYIIYEFVGYINGNFADLRWVILWTILGRIGAFLFELWAVSIDKVYLEEIGVV